uniref:Uncharacterized protein n=1 Tax=Rhizophora mucronata TaxID=61149 RepID=A0A2P2K326_RHIMU
MNIYVTIQARIRHFIASPLDHAVDRNMFMKDDKADIATWRRTMEEKGQGQRQDKENGKP